MWTITPTSSVLIVLLSWMLLCWIRIWIPMIVPAGSGIIYSGVSLLISRPLRMLYAYLGIFLLDIAFRICFSGVISYGCLGYVAVPVLLCAVIGALYVFCSTFIAPSRTTLLAFGGMLSVYLYLSVAMPLSELRISLTTGIILTLFFCFFEIFRAVMKRGVESGEQEKDRADGHGETDLNCIVFAQPLWDISSKFNYLTGTKIYIAVLILISVEFVLQIEGISLLYWI